MTTFTQDQLEILDRYVEYKIEARLCGEHHREVEYELYAAEELAKLQTKPSEQEEENER